MTYHSPGCQPVSIGVFVLDVDRDTLLFQLCPDWSFVDDTEREYFSLLHEDIAAKVHELGPRLLSYFEESLSNALQVSDRTSTSGNHAEEVLAAAYEELVAKSGCRKVSQLPMP